MPDEPESKMGNSQCRKFDRKYFAAALLILLLLITFGVIQLFPPETPPESPKHHYGNNLLILDMMGEEALKNTPDSRRILIRLLSEQQRYGEVTAWQRVAGEL